MAGNLGGLTVEELKARKKRLNTIVNTLIVGSILYAIFIFYLMFNDKNGSGGYANYLILVPVVIFFIATFFNRRRQLIDSQINKKGG